MLLERLVLFLVIGFFVFTPGVPGWWQTSLTAWYLNYLWWLAIIGICLYLQLKQGRSNAAERRPGEDQR